MHVLARLRGAEPAACRGAHYCGPDCQERHWKRYRVEGSLVAVRDLGAGDESAPLCGCLGCLGCRFRALVEAAASESEARSRQLSEAALPANVP